jgi:hypothetical protein
MPEIPSNTLDIRTDLRPRGRELIAILSVDGGGIRGLIPGRVLAALERRAGMPVCRLFDVVAGTSTGGIIALALTKPAPGTSTPQYAASDLVELYRDRGAEIFHRSFAQRVMSANGLAGPKFSADAIEEIVRNAFGEARLHDALTPVVVTSYDTAAARPYFFKSYRPVTAPDDAGARFEDDHLMWQAARATSAAPTFFPPYLLAPTDPKRPGAVERPLVDGGVYANNPAMCALADAYRMFGQRESATQFLVMSVGTGSDDLKLSYGEICRRGLLRWAIPVLQIVFDGVSDTVDYQVREMADVYYRFQREDVREGIDDVSPETIQRLLDAADALVASRAADLDQLAQLLLGNVASARPAAVPSV